MAPEYDPQTAAGVAYGRLPDELREQLTPGDVSFILGLEFEHLGSAGLVSDSPVAPDEATPVQIDVEQMVSCICDSAAERGTSYTVEQVSAVLEGEEAYMREAGIIED